MNFPGTGAGEFESEIDSIAAQVSVWLGEGGGDGGYDLLCICPCTFNV